MRKQRRGKRLGRLLLVMLFTLFLVPFAFAEGDPGKKLARGVENMFTGWLEIPDEVNDASKETNPFTALTYGLVQGTGDAITRTGVGGYDTATFLIPDYDRPHLEEEHVF